jgi:hypothetical protein
VNVSPFNFRLGRPYVQAHDPETWACPVELEPLHSRLPDVVGNSSLESLTVALRLPLYLLRGFKQDGGKLLYSDGADFPGEAYSPDLGTSMPANTVLNFPMACLLHLVDTLVFNVWLCVARHVNHDTPEAGRLTLTRSHSV